MKNKLKYICITIISLLLGIIPISAETTGISFDKSQITLGVGYSETIKYNLGSGLNSSNIVWSSSNEKVAIVSNGKITGITEGTSTITATINGYRATCQVTVSSDYIAVSGISLDKTSLTVLVGNSETLFPTITPSNATNQDITWSSSDTSVALIEEGKITGKKVGTATITATINGYRATCKVTVVDTIPLKSININKSTLTIKETVEETLKITYSPSNATNKKVTWKSSNTNVAKVNDSGKVIGIKPGTATITAISNDGGFVSTCKVTVLALSKKVTDIKLDKSKLNLVVGNTVNLKATIYPSYAENKNIIWESSDETIATVENGKVTAISPGTVDIKAISEDGKKEAICVFTITAPLAESVSFKDTEQSMYIGEETVLEMILKPTNSVIEKPIWTSSDETIATVENGVVRAISIGETIITVSTEDKSISASINVKVIDKPKEKLNITIEGYDLKFDPTIKNYTLEIGSEEELVINTNVQDEKVTINGNKNLKNGSIITITIADEEKTTYVISIKKKQSYIIIFISIISVLLLINLIRIIKKNKK